MVDGRGAAVRAALVSLMERRAPVDAREAASWRRFAAELDRLPTPLDRLADPVHVTASAVVVGPRGVLLHRHRRLGRWLQPGGHIDGGEPPVDAAVRELKEETGLDPGNVGPALLHVDVHGGGGGHVHLDLRYLVRSDGDPRPAPGESLDVAWFGWDDAVAIADPGLLGALTLARTAGAS